MELNKQQYEVKTHDNGPLIVAAVPGAGKTRCIVERIKYLLDNNVERKTILAVTFTNKAADEMKARLERDGYQIGQLTVSTFHSFCVSVLRKCGHLLGFTDNFNIYDEKDQQAQVKHVLKDLGMLKTAAALKEVPASDTDDEIKPLFDADEIVRLIEKTKNEMSSLESIEASEGIEKKEILAEYQIALKRNNSMDFSDLISNTCELFDKFPRVAEYYSSRYKHILVDEAQDTNKAQYHLIELLMKSHKNIILVGDDDQSIYGFRQACSENMLKFVKTYNPKMVKLETNYRSTPEILTVAGKLIKCNKHRIDKELKTPNPSIDGVRYLELSDNKKEAELVARIILKLRSEKGYKYSDFAILYRTNMISHEFEEVCRMFNIPYKVYGGFGFYDRKEVKTFLSYMKFLANQKDVLSFNNCVNEPRRGVGDTAQLKITKESFRTGKSILELCKEPPTEGPNKLSKAQAEGLKLFAEVFNDVDLNDAKTAVRKMADQSGLIEALRDSDSRKQENRADNVLELINSFEYWASKKDSPKISDYLQEVQLMSNEEEEIDDDHVRLMTIHSAKGLEFNCVFVVACEEGTMPHKRAVEESGPEEERRLAYVAFTRAKNYLYVTRAKERWSYGDMKETTPSRFLFESGLLKPKDEVIKP